MELDPAVIARLPLELAYTPGEARATAIARWEWIRTNSKAAQDAPRIEEIKRDMAALAKAVKLLTEELAQAKQHAEVTREAVLDAMPELGRKMTTLAREEAEQAATQAARNVGVELEGEFAASLARGPKVDPARLDKLEQKVSALSKQVSTLALRHA